MGKHLHLDDASLLRYLNGEMESRRTEEISVHLQSCSRCQARLKEFDHAFSEFGQAYLNSSQMQIEPPEASRRLLKERLANLVAQQRRGKLGWERSTFGGLHPAWALACLPLVLCLLLAIRFHAPARSPRVARTTLLRSEEPNLRLTPGATVPVTESEICGQATTPIPVVPVSLKRKVFELYGVAPSQPEAYEVDYLITPELGGSTDVKNLWPEPYRDTVWNAHVKDQLEDRLHRMVCHGDVDLPTAQRDISTDWIAAYRKYFHADRPIADSSSFNSFAPKGTNPRA